MRRALAAALAALCLSSCDNLAYDYGASGRDADGGPSDGGLLPDGGRADGGHLIQRGDLACQPGFATCAADDCGTDLTSDAHHCGACGQGCGTGRCEGGVCRP